VSEIIEFDRVQQDLLLMLNYTEADLSGKNWAAARLAHSSLEAH
jgi:hypothetical protein